MDFAKTKVNRSIERGMGPTKKAATIDLEAAALTDVPSDSVDLIVIGSMWMLRGDEVAALLIEQAHVDSDVKLARLTLGPTKRNTAGESCSRELRCSCFATVDGGRSEVGTSVCPVHALQRVLTRRTSAGYAGKHPLFPGRGGAALSPAEAVKMLRAGAGAPSLSQHSMRRMGAQFFARRGLALHVIQHMGRWGSLVVERYVAEALSARASWAPLAAAEQLDLSTWTGEAQSTRAPGLGAIAGLVRTAVRQEASRRRQSEARPCPTSASTPAPPPPAVATAPTGIRSAEGMGHRVRTMDLAIPPLQWETICGWHFGHSAFTLCPASEVSCRRCAVAVGQDGGRRSPDPPPTQKRTRMHEASRAAHPRK